MPSAARAPRRLRPAGRDPMACWSAATVDNPVDRHRSQPARPKTCARRTQVRLRAATICATHRSSDARFGDLRLAAALPRRYEWPVDTRRSTMPSLDGAAGTSRERGWALKVIVVLALALGLACPVAVNAGPGDLGKSTSLTANKDAVTGNWTATCDASVSADQR